MLKYWICKPLACDGHMSNPCRELSETTPRKICVLGSWAICDELWPPLEVVIEAIDADYLDLTKLTETGPKRANLDEITLSFANIELFPGHCSRIRYEKYTVDHLLFESIRDKLSNPLFAHKFEEQ
jgi:hypothetical protein